MGKIFIPNRGGKSPDPTAGYATGISHDVKGAETDGEYVNGLMQRKRTTADKQQDSRFFYGKATPPAPPFRAIKDAIASFKPLKSELGTAEIFRERLLSENRVDCPMQGCPLDFWNASELMRHLGKHPEVRKYSEFVNRAMADYAAMAARLDNQKQQVTASERKVAQAVALVERFEAEEKKLEKASGLDFDEDYDPVTGAVADLDAINDAIKRGGDELKRAQDRAREQRQKLGWLSSQLERNQIELQGLERRIKRFQRAPDSGPILGLSEQEHEFLVRLENAAIDFENPLGVLSRKGAIYHGQLQVD